MAISRDGGMGGGYTVPKAPPVVRPQSNRSAVLTYRQLPATPQPMPTPMPRPSAIPVPTPEPSRTQRQAIMRMEPIDWDEVLARARQREMGPQPQREPEEWGEKGFMPQYGDAYPDSVARAMEQARRSLYPGQVIEKFGIGYQPERYAPDVPTVRWDEPNDVWAAQYRPRDRQITLTRPDDGNLVHELAHDVDFTQPLWKQGLNHANFQWDWSRAALPQENPGYKIEDIQGLQREYDRGGQWTDYPIDYREIFAEGAKLYAQNRNNLPDYLQRYYDYWIDPARVPAAPLSTIRRNYQPVVMPRSIPQPPTPTPMPYPTATPTPRG